MRLTEVVEILEAKVVTGENELDVEVVMGGGSDLMSDVLAFIKPGALLLTGLTNPQVIRTAEMADIRAVALVRGKQPTPETIELAASNRLPLILTRFTMFESCGRLFEQGLPGRHQIDA